VLPPPSFETTRKGKTDTVSFASAVEEKEGERREKRRRKRDRNKSGDSLRLVLHPLKRLS